MSLTDQQFLAALPGWAFGFMLLLSRISGAMMMLPGISEVEVPVMPRAGLAFAMTVLLLPELIGLMPPIPREPLVIAGYVTAEVLFGFWMGWLVRLPMLALPMAAQIISYMLGLSSVLQPDPLLGGQSTPLARLFSLAAPVLILASGLYAAPLAALAGSYHLVPAGALLPPSDSAMTVIGSVSSMFTLAIRLAGPFIAAGILLQIVLGLAARIVPRLQIYFAALPGQILGGLALAALLAVGLIAEWRDFVFDAYSRLPGLP